MHRYTTLVSVLAAMTLLTTPAMADKPEWAGKGKGHEKYDKYDKHDKHQKRDKVLWRGDKHDDDRDVVVVIEPHDRTVIREYYVERWHCPPGLAKKHNGCMPPGQYKKHVIGEVLPVGLWEPLPQDLLVRLKPYPRGTRYVYVDQNVYLVSEASHKILDAIVLLSAAQ